MPHSLSAKKRVRQNEKRMLVNRAKKREVRTWIRKTTEFIAEGEYDQAEQALQMAHKKLDKAAKHQIFHKNSVARKKSRLNRLLNLAREGRLSKEMLEGNAVRRKKKRKK